MYQAHAQQLLNQKESETDSSMHHDTKHPLFVATRRLVAALDRLEGNLKHVAPVGQETKNGQQLVFFEQENHALRKERANLDATISQLQNQYDDLHHVASAIYGKLDDSIKRLTQLIDS